MIKRERKKTRERKINNIYMSNKQCYLKFWFVYAIAKSARDNQRQQHTDNKKFVF